MSKQEVGLLPGYVLVQVRCFRAARLPAGGLRLLSVTSGGVYYYCTE